MIKMVPRNHGSVLREPSDDEARIPA